MLLALAGAVTPGLAATSIRFRDATRSAGIEFVHSDASTGKRHIVETVTCGLGLIDFNSDGLLDILFLNSGTLPGTTPAPQAPTHKLFRNEGNGRFTDVTARSGIGISEYVMGCAVADYDNDGHEDVFITNYGAHRLLRNRGDGTFVDVTVKAGVAGASFGPTCVGAGCAFLDYDRDGYVDLFVGNYLEFDRATAQPCREVSVPVYCSPRVYPMVVNRLFHNERNGTFKDVTGPSGIGQYKGYAMGIVCSDFDGDGWTDIYVGNDVMENFLFHNKKNGTFEDIGLLAGVAYDQYGDPQGTMGSNAGDYDGDGRTDIVVTDYQNQVTTLYRNLGTPGGQPMFQDVTVATGAGTSSRPLVTWGGGFVDLDNDGVRELFNAAGHLQDTVEQYDGSSTYRQRNVLLQWRDGRFADVADESPGAMQIKESSRGAVFGDLNNDGRVDIVILNVRTSPTLMLNETPTSNHWTILKLVGTRSNRSAIGAVVRVTTGGKTQMDEVRAGRGYESAEDLRLHFGLGSNAKIDRLEVAWPSGLTEVRANLTADRVLRIVEGDSARVGRDGLGAP